MVQLPATAAIEYVAACCITRTRTITKIVPGCLCPFPPSPMLIRTVQAFCAQHRSVTDKQKKRQKNKTNGQTRPPSSAGNRPPSPNFQGMQRWMHTTYFMETLHGSDPCVRSQGRKTPPENADFATKQTNICRLSGDIMNGIISNIQ